MKRLFYLIIVGLITIFVITIWSSNKIPPTTGFDQPVQPQHVDDRQWYRIQQRGGKIETEKIVAGRQRVEKLLSLQNKKRNYKDGGIRFWNERGPGNIGGRIRAIYIRQNDFGNDRIIIGAAGGGIFTSSDDGATWSAANDFLPSLAVTSLAGINNVIYASTGEGQAARTIGLPGAGIYKSINSGLSWSQLSSTANSEFYWVNKIAINPDNANHLLAVTSMTDKNASGLGGDVGKLKESFNGGNSWTDVLTTDGFLTDVEFHPNNGNIRVVSGHGALYVYNSGSNDYESKNADVGEYPGRVEVALAPTDQNYIYAQVNSRIQNSPEQRFRSTNGGSTWDYLGGTQEVFNVGLGDYANNVWVDPLDKETVYFGGQDLWKSDDGGSNVTKISDWQTYHLNGEQLHADQHIIYPNPRYDINDRSVYFGNDGGIQKADDITIINAGISNSGYTNLANSSLNITQFYSASASPINDMIGGGTQDNSFITQVSSNDDWFQHNTGDGSMLLFHPTDPNIIYANTNHNSLWKSSNGGVSYSVIDTLGKAESQLIAPIAINPANPNKIYLGGHDLWEYDETTQSKSIINQGFNGCGSCYVTAIEVHPDGNQIYIGFNTGNVRYTSNGGAAWSEVGPGIAKIVTDIAINDNPAAGTSREAIFTLGGYNQTNIYKYSFSNNIPSWENIPLGFDMQVNTVTYHPNNKNWIYVGTDVGIFASEDKGQNWSVTPIHDGSSLAYDNEGPIYTEVSELFWDSIPFFQDWSLNAATFGRGVWFSNLILDTIHVDLTHTGGSVGTRDLPFSNFDDGLEAAQNTGAVLNVIGQGIYNEISPARLLDKRVLMKNSGGGNSIIE